MTKQRECILNVIKGSKAHLTAEEIFSVVKQQLPKISLGTVYRNLGLLTGDGIISKFESPEGKAFFDKSVIPHAHMYCRCCKRLYDYDSTSLNSFLNAQFGDRLESYEIMFNVVCDECLKEKKENNYVKV